MRIVELNLERYGPFMGERLGFRSDALLHVVYGPNEAGKSSSLAAITDLLFGIEPRTRYAFRHEGRDLRLGATVAKRDGSSLTFRRRRGRPGLVDGADAALPEDILLPYVGGVTRDVFTRAFGLNSESLRASGRELESADGDLGESLFTAASGLRGLADLRQRLEAEAAEIFVPRGRERRFSLALERYEGARKAIKQHELRQADYRGLVTGIDEAAEALRRMEVERVACATDVARLTRLRKAHPVLRLIDEAQAVASALGPLPEYSPSLTDRLAKTLAASRAAEEALRSASEVEAALERDLANLAVDAAILAENASVQSLVAGLDAYQKAAADRPRIQGEVASLELSLSKLCARLGFDEVETMLAAQPTDARMALIGELVEEGKSLDADLRHRGEAIERETQKIEELERDRLQLGAVADPGLLRERLAAYGPALRVAERWRELLAEIAREERALGDAAARTSPPVADVEALARAPLPSMDEVSAHAARFRSVELELGRARDALEERKRQVKAARRELEGLTAFHEVPSPQRIAGLRDERDRLWHSLRRVLFGHQAIETADLADAVSLFESVSREADRLVDRAAVEAERVAACADLQRRLEILQAGEIELEARIAEHAARADAAWAAWNELWTPIGIEPRQPAEMSQWLVSLRSLIDRRDGVAAKRGEATHLAEEVRRTTEGLAELAAAAGVDPLSPNDAAGLAGLMTAHLSRLDRVREQAAQIDAQLRACGERLHAAKSAKASIDTRLDAWRRRWAEIAPTIGLAANARPTEAVAALSAWREVPPARSDRENRRGRVAGMTRDMEAYEARARDLARALAPDLASAPVTTVVAELAARGSHAREQAARRGDLMMRLQDAVIAREAAARTSFEARARLDEVAASLHSGDYAPAHLHELAARLARRDAAEERLRELRQQLVLASDGADEGALRDALDGFDPDTVDAELHRLREAEDRLRDEGHKTYAAMDGQRQRLDKLHEGVTAERALQQRLCAEAELVEATHDYAVLKLATVLIGAGVERYRSRSQSPLLTRAGVLFGKLTAGAYPCLEQDIDDDVPRIVARRADGKAVRVADLSEGTRDQLYLALRLAYLRDYADLSEALPFIADDLFATFDDERTRHGIETLAAIGRSLQPILFTHHAHVVDIAVDCLGPAVDVVHLGAMRLMPEVIAEAGA